MPSSGRPYCSSAPESTTREERGTPATPLVASISISSMPNCWPAEKCTPAACATKMAASET